MMTIYALNLLIGVSFAVFTVSAGLSRDTFQLTWPWPDGESWRVGGTHGHYGIMSSLDISSFMTDCKWRSKDNKCNETTPLIYAMHSGIVSDVTKCRMIITHPTGWAIKYYHMDDIRFKDGDYVSTSEVIGRYAGDYETALCNGGGSVGPHLHIVLERSKENT